jgi:hypothetical protein
MAAMRLSTITLLTVALAGPAAAQGRPAGAVTPQIELILESIRRADTGQLAVSEEDGRFL